MRPADAEEAHVATTNLTNTDVRVRNAVMQQLQWDPEVDASAIGVAAKDQTVTLTGFIDTYAAKLAAERAAKRVRGVRAVANDIEVRLRIERSDTDIAADAARALSMIETLPETVQVTVHNAHVTLTGKVAWVYQRLYAEHAIRHLRGVRGVHNYVEVAPKAVERDVRHRIVAAMHRQADLDARRINIDIDGNVAVLAGSVDTFYQRDAAERAAHSAPGITRVDNRLVVDSPQALDDKLVDEMC